MYIIKQIPEDFIVKEKSTLEFQQNGRYFYFLMQKKNKNTLEAVQEIARALKIKENNIGFAGNKDRNAVTEQVISISGTKKENILSLNLPNIQLTFLGYRNEPLSLGELAGNEFCITVRNLEQDRKVSTIQYIVNYFDEQRFSKQNIEIGKCLLTKQFSKATTLLDNARLQSYLKEQPNDHVGALRLLPSRLLRLYLNAYQAWLWNTIVATFLSSQKDPHIVPYSKGEFIFLQPTKDLLNLEIPLPGASPLEIPSEIQAIITRVLQQENITPTDFIIRQFPGLTVMGELRRVFVEVKEFKIHFTADELHSGKNKAELQFFLPKGSYATIVIKSIFS